MMKQFFMILIGLIHCLECANVRNQAQNPEMEFIHYLEHKCTINENKEKLQVDLVNTQGCIATYTKLKKMEDYYIYYCESNYSYKCAEVLVTFLLQCLSEEEQYLTDFLLTSYNVSKNNICKEGKDHFLDTLYNLAQLDCIQNKKITEAVAKCAFDVTSEVNLRTLVLTKSFVCGKLPEFKSCSIKYISENCEGDKTIDVINEGFDSYLHWCDVN
ncbi:hypothetical protein FQA39_LY05001 [Lamprigera yunnana]|nr:hypothetical protein FQA39_LY05001 [Lamprigera yunnana]